MKWDQGHQSDNLEDRRGETPRGGGGALGGGAMMLVQMLVRRGGIWGLLAAGAVVAWTMFGPQLTGGASSSDPPADTAQLANDPRRQFVAFVLDDAQDTWTKVFATQKEPYRKAKLVLFSDRVDTGCGSADAGVGPFYCPADERVYLDLSFFEELSRRFGAPGDFAQAYVVAHEIGHHVQKVLGTSDEVHRLQEQQPANANKASVALELQADCYAGVWAHATSERKLLEGGDIDEALKAAAAVGDDTLQKAAHSTVRPETWTHGSAAERARWFKRGFDEGKIDACDTFGAQAR